MTDILAPLTPDEYSLHIPEDPIAWVAWALLFFLLVIIILRLRTKNQKINRQSLLLLALLSISVLVLTPFLGLPVNVNRFADGGASPVRHVMIFAALPWMLAGGLIGLVPAAVLAGMSGLLLAYLDTHTIFTPLVFMFISVIFSWSIRQRYRTIPFRLLRFPPFAALAGLFLTLPVIFLSQVMIAPGAIPGRIVTAVNQLPILILAYGGMLLFGGIICAFVRVFATQRWGPPGPLIAAPGETSLQFRLAATIIPLLLVLLVVLGVSSWQTASRAARQVLLGQLTQASSAVAEGLPVFLDTGENLIREIGSQSVLTTGSPAAIETFLAQKRESFAYFDQLVLLDSQGEQIAGTPSIAGAEIVPAPSEIAAVDHVIRDGSPQVLTAPPTHIDQGVRISFLSGVRSSSGEIDRVIWGWTSLDSNPMSQPLMNALTDLAQEGGRGLVIDRDGMIIYHTDAQEMMGFYSGDIYQTPTYFEGASQDGQTLAYYYHPVGDRGWAVVTSLPGSVLQSMAWQSAFPLMLIGLSTVILVILIILVGLSPLVKDIDQLSEATGKLSRGDFNIELLNHRSIGEMEKLRKSFQDMAFSLGTRSQKQADLLSVSEKITGHLKLEDSLRFIMAGALTQGVSSVRIVLMDPAEKIVPEVSSQHFGLGKHTELFAPLDGEILARTQSKGLLVLRDFQIGKTLNLQKGMPYPASMIAVPLTWKDKSLGVLWVAYQERRFPNAEEVDFFKKLSEKAVVAVVNARAFDDSLTTKMQLESVLDSLPDAVLISNSTGRVIYQNQMAQRMFEVGQTGNLGEKLSAVFGDEDLAELIDPDNLEKMEKEVQLPDGKIFIVTLSPIQIDNSEMGQAVVFRDISHHKEQESLKTEFVTTVSHELRSPLTLILGYAKILRLTGNLNEQQDTYISNIIDGVEEMKSLVKNLLDIGRLEAGDSLEISQVKAGDVAQKAVESLQAQAKQKNIDLSLSLPGEPVLIEADITFLTQALKNLLENAVKFTKMGGDVSLRVRSDGENVNFSVRDDGIGIAPLDQRQLFKKFKRVNTQVGQEQKGSGLGLAIVKSIAERHGGKVWLESQLGKGSTFYLQIPRQSNQSRR